MENRLVNCMVIDDEPRALELITEYVESLPYLKLEAAFTNPMEAITLLKIGHIDLLFLDINMPMISGIQFLKTLPRPPKCILTTAYSEFALESYELDIVDYLLKPIDFDRFIKACNKALKVIDTSDSLEATQSLGLIRIKSGQKIYQLREEEIQYIEASGNYLTFHASEKILTLMSMEEALKILPENSFLRVHRSFIVNIRNVKTFEHFQLTITNRIIPISKSFRKTVAEKIGNF